MENLGVVGLRAELRTGRLQIETGHAKGRETPGGLAAFNATRYSDVQRLTRAAASERGSRT